MGVDLDGEATEHPECLAGLRQPHTLRVAQAVEISQRARAQRLVERAPARVDHVHDRREVAAAGAELDVGLERLDQLAMRIEAGAALPLAAQVPHVGGLSGAGVPDVAAEAEQRGVGDGTVGQGAAHRAHLRGEGRQRSYIHSNRCASRRHPG